MLLRFLIVGVLLAGLGIFTVQNLTPAFALVFLGFQTPVLPLSVWLLGAIAAGACTSFLMWVLFGLASLSGGASPRSPRAKDFTGASPAANPNPASSRYEPAAQAAARTSNRTPGSRNSRVRDTDDSAWQDWRGYEAASTPRNSATAATDDWEQEFSEDWEAAPRDRADTPPSDPRSSSPRNNNFEASQTPKQTAQSGSTYSYGYQNPQETGAGKSEKVVDAEYRVLIPPYYPLDPEATMPRDRPFTPPPAAPPDPDSENADDWFEDGPDEFTDPPKQP